MPQVPKVATKVEDIGRKLSEYERGYLEAMLDGEGCLTLRKSPHPRFSHGYEWNPLVYITNTDKKLLENIKSIVGAGAIVIHQKHKNPKHKPCYRYNFGRNYLRNILPQLRLITKERQRQIVIQALKLVNHRYWRGKKMPNERDAQLEALWREIVPINKRGNRLKYWDKKRIKAF